MLIKLPLWDRPVRFRGQIIFFISKCRSHLYSYMPWSNKHTDRAWGRLSVRRPLTVTDICSVRCELWTQNPPATWRLSGSTWHVLGCFPWILLCVPLPGPSSNSWLEISKWLLRNAEVENLWVFRRLHWSVGVAYGDLTCFVPQPRSGGPSVIPLIILWHFKMPGWIQKTARHQG